MPFFNNFLQSKVGPQKLPQIGPRPAPNQAFNAVNPMANPASATNTNTNDPAAAQRAAMFQTLYQYQGPQSGPLPSNIAAPPGAGQGALPPVIPTNNPTQFLSPLPTNAPTQGLPDRTNPDGPFGSNIFPGTFGTNYDPLNSTQLGNFEDAFNAREPLRDWNDARRKDTEFDYQGPALPTEGYTGTGGGGLANFPGFPNTLDYYAQGNNAVKANMQQEFLNIAQGYAQGNDAVTRRAIQVLVEEFNFPQEEINKYLGSLSEQAPYGAGQSVTQSREYGDPVIGTGAIPGYAAAIPSYYKQNMTEDEARTAQLYDLSLQRQKDDIARAQQQEFLLTQKGRLDTDPLAMALQGDVMSRLQNPNSIDDATKERIFGQLADTAASTEQSQLSSLAAMLGGRGLEGSGIGAGLGAQFAQQRQKSLLDNRREVEIQQAMQAAQDRAAAQASANAFFQGREGLLGSIANNIASLGVKGDITHLGGELPNMPSEIANAAAIRRAQKDDSGILGSILGGVGSLAGGFLGGQGFANLLSSDNKG